MRFKQFLLENDSGLKSFEEELQKKYGLSHLRLYKKGNDLILDMIVVPKDKRKQGIGSKVLEDITHYADVNGLRTLLTTAVKDDYHGTTSGTRLKAFYKKFGFVENKGRYKDFTTTHNMIREPKKKVLKESEENIPDTVKVNGVERSTKNNLGEYIYGNADDIISFWKWFGDSKIVDNQGRPILATHTTNNKFSEFDTEKTSSGAAWGKGIYFSLDKKWSGGKFTKHCYLKSLSPLVGNKITKEDRAKLSKYVGREVETLPILTLEKRGGDLISGLVLAGFDSFIGDGPGSTGLHIVVPNKNQIREVKETEKSVNESFETDYNKFIAYHQTSKENANRIKRSGFNFKNSLQNIIWFTNNKNGISENSTGSSKSGSILKLEVTIKKAADWDLYDSKTLDELESLGYDGVILKEKDGTFDGFVFSPKQLKVLDVVDSVDDIKESEERKHGKLLSEIKPTLKTVMIFRARDDKSDEFESKDYVTLSSKFALEHAESNHVYTEEPHIVIRTTVPTNKLAEASNPGEWFYIGPKIHGDVVYKTLGPENYDSKIIDLKFARKLKL